MTGIPESLADIERMVARTLRFLLRWVIASVAVILIAALWSVLSDGNPWSRMLLLVGAGSLLFAQGTLTGFQRGITVNNRAIRIAQRKRAAGGNGGPP